MSVDVALTYATLLLVDAQKDITSANLLSITKAAGVNVDKSSADVFAKFATPSMVDALIEKLTAVGSSGSAPVAAAASSAPAAVEAKKEESEEEEDGDAFGGLF